MTRVFLGSEALAKGELTEYELRRWHRRIFRDVYVDKHDPVSLRDRIAGAWLRSGRHGIIAGVAASALHGASWVDDDIPIEMIWSATRSPRGIVARDERVTEDEVIRINAVPVTTRARTAFDLGRHLSRGDAIARLDALMWSSPFSTERRPQQRRCSRFRRSMGRSRSTALERYRGLSTVTKGLIAVFHKCFKTRRGDPMGRPCLCSGCKTAGDPSGRPYKNLSVFMSIPRLDG